MGSWELGSPVPPLFPCLIDGDFEEFRDIHDKLKKGVSVDYNTMMTALFGGIFSLVSKINNLRKDYEPKIRATNRKFKETNGRLDDALSQIAEI